MRATLYYRRDIWDGDGVECYLALYNLPIASAQVIGLPLAFQEALNEASEVLNVLSDVETVLGLREALRSIPLTLAAGLALPCYEFLDGIGSPVHTLTDTYEFFEGSAYPFALPQVTADALGQLGAWAVVGLVLYYQKPRDWSFLPNYDPPAYYDPYHATDSLWVAVPRAVMTQEVVIWEMSAVSRSGYYVSWEAKLNLDFAWAFLPPANSSDIRYLPDGSPDTTWGVWRQGNLECNALAATDFVDGVTSKISGTIEGIGARWEFAAGGKEQHCYLPVRFCGQAIFWRPGYVPQTSRPGGSVPRLLWPVLRGQGWPGGMTSTSTLLSLHGQLLTMAGVGLGVKSDKVRE